MADNRNRPKLSHSEPSPDYALHEELGRRIRAKRRLGVLVRVRIEGPARSVAVGEQAYAIKQGNCHPGSLGDGDPSAEAWIGGDDHAGALEELAQQMQEQRVARRPEWRVNRDLHLVHRRTGPQ